ncbi:hypothetical protein J4558_25050 [Leptolyngbya sp. 15MV]|nr:hypothetical protein J4558_25050 [Leptolyngbya sp. 15MV]
MIIEFHKPGSTVAAARWDFPVSYDGTGFDDMWDDREFFRQHFAKAPTPPTGSDYRILLTKAPGAPKVAGVGDTSFLSTDGMVVRQAGTVIATPHLTASARYYHR